MMKNGAGRYEEKTIGLFYALGAFFLWGLLPIYWKSLKSVDALQILCHRLFWSAVFICFLLIVIRKRGREFLSHLTNPRTVGLFLMTALIIGSNWFIYIWAVNANFVLETSLGYFISPLASVLLGVVFLKERLRFWQSLSVLFAFAGVLYLTANYGQLPWIALALAVTFSIYGLIRKLAKLDSIMGLAMETLFLAPFALAYLIQLEKSGVGSFGHADWGTNLLLLGSGLVSATPLLWFAHAARRLRMTTLGFLQYIGPSCQFLLATLVYGEVFTPAYQICFGAIWLALIIFSTEAYLFEKRLRRTAVAPAAA